MVASPPPQAACASAPQAGGKLFLMGREKPWGSVCAHRPQSWLPTWLRPPSRYVHTSVRSPEPLTGELLQSSELLSGLSLDSSSLSHLSPRLSCTGEPRTGPSTPGVAPPALSRGEGCPPSPCWQCYS